jgi:hypothetical protein
MTDIDPPPSLPPRFRTPAAKIGFLLGLLLLLQIPQLMVSGLIDERTTRQAGVRIGFQQAWGPEQTVASPMLVVPYTVLVTNSPGPRRMCASPPCCNPRRGGGGCSIPRSIRPR